MMQLGAKVNLLICQKSKMQDWIEHFIVNYSMNHCWIVYDLTKKNEIETFVKATSDGWNDPIIGIINYELAWRRPELLKLNDFTLMLDESSLIQNRKAKQSKFILKLNAANVILLSGTPTSGKYENLWTQLHLLGWGISEKLFQQQYVEYDYIYNRFGQKMLNPITGKPLLRVVGYKNFDRLKSKLREYGADFLKTEDVMTLPEQTFVEVKVPKSKLYAEFMKKSIVEVEGNTLIGDTTFSKRIRARQLCGQYSKEKLEAFRDLLTSTNDRLIVFYNFNEELQKLKIVCEEFNKPISEINGNVKDLTAYENESDSVTLCQYQAGSMGHNLQLASKMIFFSLPERSDLFEQAKKRIHRIGQKNTCFYYVLICAKSVEESIYETLKLRKDYTDELFRKEF